MIMQYKLGLRGINKLCLAVKVLSALLKLVFNKENLLMEKSRRGLISTSCERDGRSTIYIASAFHANRHPLWYVKFRFRLQSVGGGLALIFRRVC